MVNNVAHDSPLSLEICRQYHYWQKYMVLCISATGYSHPNKAPVPPSTLPQAVNGICIPRPLMTTWPSALINVLCCRSVLAETHHLHWTFLLMDSMCPPSPAWPCWVSPCTILSMGHPHSRDDHESQHEEVLSGHPETCWNHHQTFTQFYMTFIQSGLEYAAPVWHPSIAQTLSDNIERVQQAILHIICPELSYEHSLNKIGLPTLHTTWQQLCLRFARSLYDNPNFRH